MSKNNWSVIVGNIGTVFTGTNGAQAMREFGQWRKKSEDDEGRAAGEPVTLMCNDNPARKHGGHSWFCYRQGDGNEGNYPQYMVRVSANVNAWRYLAACVANRYISGSRTRAHIVREIQTDGEFEYGIIAWVYEGPKGETAFDAAWITAEFEPASPADYSSLPQFKNPADHLDRSAMRMLKKD